MRCGLGQGQQGGRDYSSRAMARSYAELVALPYRYIGARADQVLTLVEHGAQPVGTRAL